MVLWVVLLFGMYVRTVKVPSSNGTVNEYLRVVEAYRENGKVKQRIIAELGRRDMLSALLPNLRRILEGTPKLEGQEENDVDILDTFTWGPLLVARKLFEQLGLWDLLDRLLGTRATVPWADRAFVLIASRLIHPSSEHGLAGWLETDYFCDRAGRRFVPRWHQRGRVRVHDQQLDSWYRTLDHLLEAKEDIERALYERLRDLFSLKPDLVLYDITSTYFEGTGPQGLARHGYSRDGKSRNPQVIVGVVMVSGWPIVHHVWEGNRLDHSTVAEVIKELRERFEFARVVFVGDRGMVTEENLKQLLDGGQGYLVGVKRRGNAQIARWLDAIDETKWVDCPVGIASAEKTDPPRTRVQEVPSGKEGMRVFVIDSDERRQYEESMRGRSWIGCGRNWRSCASAWRPAGSVMRRRSALRQNGSCRLIMGIAITAGGLMSKGASPLRKTRCACSRRNESKANTSSLPARPALARWRRCGCTRSSARWSAASVV